MDRRRFLGTAAALLASAGGILAACASFGAGGRNAYYKGPPSDHFDGVRFFNPQGTAPKGLGDFLRWRFGGGRARWPDSWPSPAAPMAPERRLPASALRVTLVGHATLLVQTSGLNILTDPIWSERASPFSFLGPKRVNQPGVPFASLPPIDVVLVTHNHYDHLDVATLGRLQAAFDPLLVTPLGNDEIIRREVPEMRIAAHDWGQSVAVGPVRLHLEPCHHWSARGLRDRRMALWAAFVIEGPAGKLLHVGDTGYNSGRDYRGIRDRHGKLRVAILPVGAYEPRWFMRSQHQNPDEAVRGFLDCGAEQALGHHWGTFQLTNEAIDAPLLELEAALERHGVAPDSFPALRPGERWDAPPSA